MPKNPRILAFAGSLREKSYSKRVLKVAVEGARRAGAEVTLIDLKDYPMPIYNADLQETQGFPPIATALQKLMLEHDGFLVASPEFNASLPAVLKNAIDWTSRPNENLRLGETYKGRVAAIISASPGAFGGVRCLGHLRDVLTLLQVHVLPQEIAVAKVGGLFEGDGDEMTNTTMRGVLEDLGASLVEMLRKMRPAEEEEEEAGESSAEENAASRMSNTP